MIRVLKKYRFEIHQTANEDSPMVPGHSMSFSSYPGLLYSGDDFTILSSGIVAMETTIGNSNADLWKYIKPTGQVLEGIRSVVANRLATTGKSRHKSCLCEKKVIRLCLQERSGPTYLDVTTAALTTISGWSSITNSSNPASQSGTASCGSWNNCRR